MALDMDCCDTSGPLGLFSHHVVSHRNEGACGDASSLMQVNIANENDLHMLLRSEKADIEQTTFSGAQVRKPPSQRKIWRSI